MREPDGGGRILVDARPLQEGGDAQRGLGSYVRGLLAGFIDIEADARIAVLFDARREIPEFPRSSFVAYTVGRRYSGRRGLFEDAAAMGRDLARIRPAVYHATTLVLPGRSPVPLVATLHDLIPWALGGWRMLGERTRWRLGRRLLGKADHVIAVSESSAADGIRLAGLDPERVTVVPEGLAPGFKPAAGAEARVAARCGLSRPYLLYVGALHPRKDPRALMRTWQVARAGGADVDLVLAGSGSKGSQVGDARRLGYVSHAELVDLYSAASCLVFPSRYEGFGLPVLEAMGCGCPVVAFRNSSLPEVTGEAALLVADGDVDALGRAAASIVLEPDRAAALRREGLAQAGKFSWSRAARATMAVYDRLGVGAQVERDRGAGPT